jgi:hypothetical protein
MVVYLVTPAPHGQKRREITDVNKGKKEITLGPECFSLKPVGTWVLANMTLASRTGAWLDRLGI